jgi:hypothetical protein
MVNSHLSVADALRATSVGNANYPREARTLNDNDY